MKKIFLSLALIFSFGSYAVFNQVSASDRTVSGSIAGSTQAAPVIAAPAPVNAGTTGVIRRVVSEGEYEDGEDGQGTVAASIPSAPATTPLPVRKPVPTPTPVPVTKPKGQYTDGTYTGSPADAYYGTVQVQAVITGGKLTDVKFLSYPNDRHTSQRINNYAMSTLTQEAIQAQSANVDIVSGASDTSAAFQQSLGDALAQAKA